MSDVNFSRYKWESPENAPAAGVTQKLPKVDYVYAEDSAKDYKSKDYEFKFRMRWVVVPLLVLFLIVGVVNFYNDVNDRSEHIYSDFKKNGISIQNMDIINEISFYSFLPVETVKMYDCKYTLNNYLHYGQLSYSSTENKINLYPSLYQNTTPIFSTSIV